MDRNIQTLIARLSAEHPNPICELDYNSPFELLVAVILSAQCTDKRVNLVTPKLFAECNTPIAIAMMTESELIPYIRTCGFYNNKSRAIIESARSIVEDYDGLVPSTIAELMTLTGVGRKTANVIYSVAFGGQAIAVDTHVFRVSNRIGLAHSSNVLEVERQLNLIIPESEWTKMHHLLIHHGRYTCKSRNPQCMDCSIADMCDHFNR